MGAEFTTNSVMFFLFLGLIAGILSATFGVGSGIIVVPLLTLVAALPQKEAQGAALALMIPMALMGALRYHLNPEIHMDYKMIGIIAVTCVIGSNIGASIAGYLSNRILQFGFSIILLIMSIRMFLTAMNK